MKTPRTKHHPRAPPARRILLTSGVEATKTPEPDPDNDQAALDLNTSRSIAMETPTPTQQTASSAVTDLQALRLPSNYGAS